MISDPKADLGRPTQGWRRQAFEVIFESETPAGRAFDKVIIAAILVSVAIVIADSVPRLNERYRTAFNIAEWLFTLLFTVEYIARIVSVERPWRYVRSFFGIVDLLSVLPTYLAMFFPETHALIDVRILRLLRVFRVFKLTDYVAEYQMLGEALAASRRKIMVFLSAVLMVVLVVGTLLYVVEGPAHGFKDIPTSVYWAITTITTVGFGDITPKTEIGRFIASVMMLIGWGTLAVPTGIVTAEMTARRHFGALAPLTPLTPLEPLQPFQRPPPSQPQPAALNIRTVFAHVSCSSIDASAAWYEKLFGVPPIRRPMPGLVEWQFSESAEVQLFEEPAHAGASTLTLGVLPIETERHRLRVAGLEPGEIEETDGYFIMRIRDPDQNLVVFASAKRN